MSTFNVRIVTPAREVFAGAAEYLSLNTPDGRAGFMRGALPRIAVITAGEIEIKAPWSEEKFLCGDGVMHISAEETVILTTECSKAGEVVRQDNNAEEIEKDYKYAKARVVSSIRKMKKKGGTDE